MQAPVLCLDLTNMYKLLKPIQGGLGLLVQEMEDHIRCTGLEAIKNLKGENVSDIKHALSACSPLD